MHTIEKFSQFDPAIDIIVVLPENHFGYWSELCEEYKFPVAHRIATGGKERFYSVQNGLKLVKDEGVVFIHDGVRPLVNKGTLQRCYEAAIKNGNALPVVPVSESVRFIENDISKPIDRTKILLVQTPQTFKVSLIKEAYRQAYNHLFTDDATVFENAGHLICLTEGNPENIKITWPSDLIWAETVINI
jgi:2-C-methyl-D-erythritol 4-phosphate cytidylyltransferase